MISSAAALSAEGPFDVFFNADKLTAMIAKAKAERKPDQGNFVQPLWGFAPYHANLEYRVHGIDTPPNVHEQDKEIIYVVQGAAKLTMGGHLRDAAARIIDLGFGLALQGRFTHLTDLT